MTDEELLKALCDRSEGIAKTGRVRRCAPRIPRRVGAGRAGKSQHQKIAFNAMNARN